MNIVWTKSGCPFCDMAKELLDQKGIIYEERNISNEWSKEQLLESVPNAKTVPQIFLDASFNKYHSLVINIYSMSN